MTRRAVPPTWESKDDGGFSAVEDMANCVMINPGLVAQLEALGFKSKNDEGMTFREAMICSQIANAVKGDLQAYRAVMDYSSERDSSPLVEFVKSNLGPDALAQKEVHNAES